MKFARARIAKRSWLTALGSGNCHANAEYLFSLVNTGRIKKGIAVIVIAAMVILAVVDFVRDFSANDTVKYFAEQPPRLLLVACIALIGGLIAFVFDRMSLSARRRVKLIALGFAASFATAFAVWCLFQSATLLSWIHQSQMSLPGFDRWAIVCFIGMPLCFLAAAILLWSLFYQTFNRRVE